MVLADVTDIRQNHLPYTVKIPSNKIGPDVKQKRKFSLRISFSVTLTLLNCWQEIQLNKLEFQ